MNESTMQWNEKNTKANETDAPARFLRREWKHNKPHLQKSTSVPILSLLPTTRPHFTCQRCGFTNTQIPMCLWCCWTSKDGEAAFEKSMPRARRVSAPMRTQGLVERRKENHAKRDCVIDAMDAPVMCRNDRSLTDKQDRGARRFGHKTDRPGFCATEVAEPTTRGMHSGSGVDPALTRSSPGFQATDKHISSLRDAIGGIMGECQRRWEWAESHDTSDSSRKGKPVLEPMSSMQSVMTPPTRKSGMKTTGDGPANDSILITASESSGRSLLPLRLRRLKGGATPLYIDLAAKPALTSAINPTSPPIMTATDSTATSPMPSPRALRRKSHLKIFRSGCSPNVANGTRPMTGTESSSRRPKSDPFGEILRLQNRTGTSSPFTLDSTSPTPTRPRAATTSALSQDHLRPATPSTPALSVRSGIGSPTHPKPLYSAIRKNGVCLSPTPLSLPSPSYMTSGIASPRCSSGKVNEYGVGSGNGYGSPASSVFPLYPGETMLLSLSLDSRPSSSSSTSSSSARGDAFSPLSLLKAKCGCGPKLKSRKRKHENPRLQPPAQMNSIQNGSVHMSAGMPVAAGVEPGMVYQRVFQVPVTGPGTGCSMSGETELKLALARHDRRPSIQLSRGTSPAESTSAIEEAELNGSRSTNSKQVNKVMRKLREMVSRTFDTQALR